MQLQYKGLKGTYHFAVGPGIYVGEIIHVNDVVAFSAQSLGALQQQMKEAVENYLALSSIETAFLPSKSGK